MSFFRFFKPASPQTGGSPQWQAFARSYLSDAVSEEQIRNGLEPGVIERLTDAERAEAERLLLARLAQGGDSRAAVGLGLLRSTAAVEPLRRAMLRQAGQRPFSSPAYAEALWRIARDPAAIDAVVAIARDAAVHESMRVDAVVALPGMAAPQAVQALQEMLRSEPAYLLRYHAFKGILMLHGYPWKEAGDHVGAMAPQIAAARARPEALQAVLVRLDLLTQGRAMSSQP